MILNLKRFNQYVAYHHFKMDTLDTVIKLMKPGCYMASIDLRDAYYTVAIHPDHQKYLKFVANGVLYQYTCLPNGLASAPRIFTKLMKPVYSTLRSMGQIISGYIDDSYLQGDSVAACSSNVKASATLMNTVGLFLHPDKSVLSPAQTVTFLGFVLNSLNMTVSPTPKKISKTITCCTELLQTLRPTILQVSRVVGVLISNLPGVEFGQLHYRSLEIDKISALKTSGSNYNAVMELCPRSINDLNWWIGNISLASKSIVKSHPSYIIKSDVSTLGWGAVLDSQAIGGRWTVSESSYHINYLELLAAFFALKAFCLNCQRCTVQLQLDNSTAVTYINNMGGTKSLVLNELTIQMWEWSIKHSIWISAVHIAGASNHEADKKSRIFHDQHEYMLNVSSFRTIVAKYPNFNVDLFASRLNHQLQQYVSWKPDPGCITVDAFSLNWHSYNFMPFHPLVLSPGVYKRFVWTKLQASSLYLCGQHRLGFQVCSRFCISNPGSYWPNQHSCSIRSSQMYIHFTRSFIFWCVLSPELLRTLPTFSRHCRLHYAILATRY